MAQNTLIARAGRSLLDVLTLLMRGVGALCAAIGSAILFIYANEDSQSAEEPAANSNTGDHIVGQDEAEHYGWDSW